MRRAPSRANRREALNARSSGRRISLAIHPGALGDVLLAIPALRALRGLDPSAPVVLAAEPRVAGLVQAIGEVDGTVPLDSLELHRLFADEQPEVTDAFAHGSLAHASRLVCWLGAHDPAFVRRLTRLVPGAIVARSIDPEMPVWRHLVATAAEGCPSRCGPVAVSEALARAGARLLTDAGWDSRTPLVLVQPGAGGLWKRWPPRAFAAALSELTGSLPLQVALHRGPADGDAVIQLRTRLAHPALVLDEPALPVLAGVLRHAAAFIGNDSGVSHLAAAVGAPAVILFTAAMRRWHPWAPEAQVVEITTGGLDTRDVRHVIQAVTHVLGRRATRGTVA